MGALIAAGRSAGVTTSTPGDHAPAPTPLTARTRARYAVSETAAARPLTAHERAAASPTTTVTAPSQVAAAARRYWISKDSTGRVPGDAAASQATVKPPTARASTLNASI